MASDSQSQSRPHSSFAFPAPAATLSHIKHHAFPSHNRTHQLYIWFCGIISTRRAESILSRAPSGAFLVRIHRRRPGWVGDETPNAESKLGKKG